MPLRLSLAALVLAALWRSFFATARATAELTYSGGGVLEHSRRLLKKVERHVVPMRIGLFVAVVHAVWKPVA